MTTPERLTDSEPDFGRALRAWATHIRACSWCLVTEAYVEVAGHSPCEAYYLSVVQPVERLEVALDAERSTRVELEAARARLQTALDQATQERGHYRDLATARLDEPSAYRAEIEGVCAQLAEAQDRAEAASARADEAERALADACSEACMAFCLYCGDAIEYRMADGPKAAHDRMLAHDAACVKNPHLARAQAAEAEAAGLRAALERIYLHDEKGSPAYREAEAALAAPAGGLLDAVRASARVLAAEIAKGRDEHERAHFRKDRPMAECDYCLCQHLAVLDAASAALAAALAAGTAPDEGEGPR